MPTDADTFAISPPRARAEDIFDAWVFAAFDAAQALADWLRSDDGDRADAHAAYRAALDREEQAALVLARAVT
jgi:hypothetical protein